jgi:hypothetical protein
VTTSNFFNQFVNATIESLQIHSTKPFKGTESLKTRHRSQNHSTNPLKATESLETRHRSQNHSQKVSNFANRRNADTFLEQKLLCVLQKEE